MSVYNVGVSDVENRWRPLSTAEAAIADVFLEDIAADLILRRPTLHVFLDSLTTSVEPADQMTGAALRRVVVNTIALRVKWLLRNPDLYRNVSIGADGAIGIGYENDSRDEVSPRLTADDLADIDAAVNAAGGDVTARVGSVRLRAHPPRVTNPYALPTP